MRLYSHDKPADKAAIATKGAASSYAHDGASPKSSGSGASTSGAPDVDTLSGLVVVFTGTFVYGTRKIVEVRAAKLGVKIGGSVSKHTDILVIGGIVDPRGSKEVCVCVCVCVLNSPLHTPLHTHIHTHTHTYTHTHTQQDKAEEIGVPMISEEEWEDMIKKHETGHSTKKKGSGGSSGGSGSAPAHHAASASTSHSSHASLPAKRKPSESEDEVLSASSDSISSSSSEEEEEEEEEKYVLCPP